MVKNKYHVRIGYGGTRYDLGMYFDFSEAALVRLEKEEELYEELMPIEHKKILKYLRAGNELDYGNQSLIAKIINEND